MSAPATLLAVSRLHTMRPGYFHDTAIDKRPVAGPVRVETTGIEGDRQVDSSHGGVDRAVYAFADEDAARWAADLGRDLPPGFFGDNLRTRGLDVCGARIGERWRIGSVLLEVRMPRTPCQNLSMRVGEDGFHLRFNASGSVGAMLAVLEPGTLEAGDPVEVVERPDHDVTVADLATGTDAVRLQAMLDSGASLSTKVRAKARRVVNRAAQSGTQQRP